MRNILVVDDDKEIANLISIYLKNEGFNIRCAHDGEEALKLLNDPNEAFDLVILDVMMPKMNGLEVCRAGTGHRLRHPDPDAQRQNGGHGQNSRPHDRGRRLYDQAL